MSNVIKVENLYKQYRLGQVSTGSIAHDLNRWWHTVRGKDDPYEKITGLNNRDEADSNEYVWALQDINFSVKQGEVLGIIGRNGAGKSTLLKILSKVTSPTKGNIKVKGRIASLLEVGTGFHPELTGRENIFLNGAILGMTKSEIRSKFDEIVAFSGVEKYIDTPVKRYSSGMYVRLAFAVAAHLEPEILIVDEVLAVGDAEFQKKCLGKMKDVSGEGRAVLFVSHNMAAVKSLCNRAIVLENGMVILDDIVDAAVHRYMTNDSVSLNRRFFGDSLKNEFVVFNSVSIKNLNREENDLLVENQVLFIDSEFILRNIDPQRIHITYHLCNQEGDPMFSFYHDESLGLVDGPNKIRCAIPACFLQSGQFFLHLYVVIDKKKSILKQNDVLMFNVVDGERPIGVYMGREPGYIRPKFEWTNLISSRS
jgi:lipopolysaccharide transport system ATP-binding protein